MPCHQDATGPGEERPSSTPAWPTAVKVLPILRLGGMNGTEVQPLLEGLKASSILRQGGTEMLPLLR